MRPLFIIHLFALLLICALGCNALQAQGKVTFMGGWNFATLSGEGAPSKNLSGLYAGATLNMKLIPLLTASTGLIYRQNGARNANALDESEMLREGDLRLNYLEVPAELRIKLGPLRAMAGVSGAYRIVGKIGEFNLDQDAWNRFDFATHLGAGFSILILKIDVRYHWGISDVSNGKSTEGNDWKNRYLAVGLSITL